MASSQLNSQQYTQPAFIKKLRAVANSKRVERNGEQGRFQNEEPPRSDTFHRAETAPGRLGYFVTRNFITYQQVRQARIYPVVDRELTALLDTPNFVRFMKAAGFEDIEQDVRKQRLAKEIVKASMIVLAVNNIQWPVTHPNHLFRVSSDLQAYLNDRPSQMQNLHLIGESMFDAYNFQRLIQKLMWSTGGTAIHLDTGERYTLIRAGIDASMAPLRAVFSIEVQANRQRQLNEMSIYS